MPGFGNNKVQISRSFSCLNQNRNGENNTIAELHIIMLARCADCGEEILKFGSKLRQRYRSTLIKVRLHRIVKPHTS